MFQSFLETDNLQLREDDQEAAAPDTERHKGKAIGKEQRPNENAGDEPK